MKKIIQQEVELCDRCEKQCGYLTKCLNCSKGVCFDCRDIWGKKYAHGVYVSGSDDGYYCGDCNQYNLVKNKALFNAYKTVESLTAELKYFNQEFTKRSDAAETQVRELRETNG